MEFLFFKKEALFIEFFDLDLVTEIIFELSFGIFELDSERLDFNWETLDFDGLEDYDHIHTFRQIIFFVAG